MLFSTLLMRKIDAVDPELQDILRMMVDEIDLSREKSAMNLEFKEFKEILKELAHTTKELGQAQKHTDQRLAEFQKHTDQSIAELAQAQKHTDQSIAELAQAQKQTEQRMERLAKAQEDLAEAQKQTEKEVSKLSKFLGDSRRQIGGLSRSVAYALENEAYRKLPEYLKTHCHLHISDRFVRTVIGGEEINIFAKAKRDGEHVLIVGEAVLKLDDRSKMKQLEKNVEAVQKEFNQTVVPLVITHFAHPNILEKASKEGVLIVQSFEWG